MTVFGQLISVFSTVGLVVAVMLTALGKLPYRLLLIAGIATSALGLTGNLIAGPDWGIMLRAAALVAFITAFAVHRYTARTRNT